MRANDPIAAWNWESDAEDDTQTRLAARQDEIECRSGLRDRKAMRDEVSCFQDPLFQQRQRRIHALLRPAGGRVQRHLAGAHFLNVNRPVRPVKTSGNKTMIPITIRNI